MRELFFLLVFIGALCRSLQAVEQISLTNAYVVNPTSTTKFEVESLYLDRLTPEIRIRISTTTAAGYIYREFSYYGSTATSLMNTLNKANLTTNSLYKRIMNQLINDGFLSGSVLGTPD